MQFIIITTHPRTHPPISKSNPDGSRMPTAAELGTCGRSGGGTDRDHEMRPSTSPSTSTFPHNGSRAKKKHGERSKREERQWRQGSGGPPSVALSESPAFQPLVERLFLFHSLLACHASTLDLQHQHPERNAKVAFKVGGRLVSGMISHPMEGRMAFDTSTLTSGERKKRKGKAS